MKKNNCLFILDKPSNEYQTVLDTLDEFFNELSATHYVYVADPGRSGVDDTPGGARYLRWSENIFDAFGDLATVVVVNDNERYRALRGKLPDSIQIVSIELSSDKDEPVREMADYFFPVSLQRSVPRANKAAA